MSKKICIGSDRGKKYVGKKFQSFVVDSDSENGTWSLKDNSRIGDNGNIYSTWAHELERWTVADGDIDVFLPEVARHVFSSCFPCLVLMKVLKC